MNFLEKDLEQIIFETDNQFLRNRGLKYIDGEKRRQVRIGNYGIADLITIQRVQGDEFCNPILFITCFELKQNIIDYNSLKQVSRYKKGILEYLKFRNFEQNVIVRMVLVGKTVDESDFCYLIDFVEYLTVYTYDYKVDGINFESHKGYHLTKNGFYK